MNDPRASWRSEQRAQLAVEVARLGTWSWGVYGTENLVRVDTRCREISGLAMEAEPSRDAILARVHPGDRARIAQALKAALDPAGNGLLSEELRFRHVDGTVRWAVVRGRADFVGRGAARRAMAMFGSLIDVTEQVSANEKYRTLFEAIDQGFCVIEVLFDDEGHAVDYRFLEVNPSFVAQTGLHEAVGKRMRELAPAHEEHWFRLYGEVARTGVPIRFEHEAAQLGRWYDVYAYRVGDPLAHQVGILFADITARKQSEEALLEADRRKDAFLATLAHELRNPLAPLRNALDVLGLSNDPELARQMHAVMSRQVHQLSRLVDELMDISRIGRGQVELKCESVDVRTVVAHAVETSRPVLMEARQVLEVDVPETPLLVEGDAPRLEQVVVNLLNNAARHGRRGGHVGVRAWREGAQVAIAVRDDGSGIPPDKLRTIFEPFTQLGREVHGRQQGMGVGLALVQGLVHLHAGEVVVSSGGEGRGSEFVVRLPAWRPREG